jgi:adenine-specific DNA-methyltransferase
MDKLDKLYMCTPNLANRNCLLLAELFPNAITETIDENGVIVRAIDKDVLEQEINAPVVEGKEERYQFTWPDKKKSISLGNAPIAATVRPRREESVNFDTTENLYIEGDNLDVLKLLRETYLNRVKMIYIDPPYNTGNDFVYEDDFVEKAAEFLVRDGQYDEDGNRMVKNLDSNGRFHTDWLNMIYPRLRIARDLLTDNGLIFISIDDNESANLRKLCNDVFGEINFLNEIRWINNLKGRQISNFGAAKTNETILVYSKNSQQAEEFMVGAEVAARLMPDAYKNVVYETQNDEHGRFVVKNELYNTNSIFNEETRRNLVFDILYNLDTGAIIPVDLDGEVPSGFVVIHPHNNADGVHRYHAWRWSRDKIINESHNLLVLKKNNGEHAIYTKIREFDEITLKDLITNISNGQKEVDALLGKRLFDYPKSVALLKLLISATNTADSIVLDFFSGSATTAHAVMQLNAEDGGKRKFIMVQLPEVTGESSEAFKAGYANICEIGKERIRRAGQKIQAEWEMKHQQKQISYEANNTMGGGGHLRRAA